MRRRIAEACRGLPGQSRAITPGQVFIAMHAPRSSCPSPSPWPPAPAWTTTSSRGRRPNTVDVATLTTSRQSRSTPSFRADAGSRTIALESAHVVDLELPNPESDRVALALELVGFGGRVPAGVDGPITLANVGTTSGELARLCDGRRVHVRDTDRGGRRHRSPRPAVSQRDLVSSVVKHPARSTDLARAVGNPDAALAGGAGGLADAAGDLARGEARSAGTGDAEVGEAGEAGLAVPVVARLGLTG